MKQPLNLLTLFTLILLLNGCLNKVNYVGVWKSDAGNNTISNLNTWDEFIADGNIKANEQNLRLVDFEVIIETIVE